MAGILLDFAETGERNSALGALFLGGCRTELNGPRYGHKSRG